MVVVTPICLPLQPDGGESIAFALFYHSKWSQWRFRSSLEGDGSVGGWYRVSVRSLIHGGHLHSALVGVQCLCLDHDIVKLREDCHLLEGQYFVRGQGDANLRAQYYFSAFNDGLKLIFSRGVLHPTLWHENIGMYWQNLVRVPKAKGCSSHFGRWSEPQSPWSAHRERGDQVQHYTDTVVCST